jgi:phage FluMu protein gp41
MSSNLKGKLKHGLKLGDVVHKDFELREAITDDLFQAEKIASEQGGGTHTPLVFQAALLTLQLVRVGDYSGPFTLKMIGSLKKGDFVQLRQAQEVLEGAGESEQPGEQRI